MKVEVLAPPDNSFVVGRDLVGYAKIGSDPDEWEDLIDDAGAFTAQRGGTTARVNTLDVGALSVPVKDADPVSDFRLRVGRRIRLYDDARSKSLWVGRISDIPAVDEVDYLVTTLAGADAVDELAQSTQKGAGTPGEVESLKSRVERLGATTTVPIVYRQDAVVLGNFSKGFGGAPVQPSTPVRAGHRYRVTFAWAAGTTTRPGVSPGYAQLDYPGGGRLLGFGEVGNQMQGTEAVEFTPNAAGDMVLRVHADANEPITITNLTVTRLEGPAVLQAVGTEGPITDHLDMACDSVGAMWRPTLEGVIEVIEGTWSGLVVAHLADDLQGSTATASFTKLEMGFAATDDLINDLTVTNHGPSADTTRVYTNAASMAAYGRRATTIDTCLATSELMDARAAEVMDAADEPRWAPRSLTYAYDDLDDVPDLYDLIAVTRRGVLHTCQVVSVLHDVQPDPKRPDGEKHFVTLTLRKVA